jgi:hypothetical protein
MIHYDIWFAFRPGIQPREGLHGVRTFLDEMTRRGLVHGFELLRNRDAGAEKSREFKATIVFADATAFARGFQTIEHAGVKSGLHGLMVETIQDFTVEVFENIEAAGG